MPSGAQVVTAAAARKPEDVQVITAEAARRAGTLRFMEAQRFCPKDPYDPGATGASGIMAKNREKYAAIAGNCEERPFLLELCCRRGTCS